VLCPVVCPVVERLVEAVEEWVSPVLCPVVCPVVERLVEAVERRVSSLVFLVMEPGLTAFLPSAGSPLVEVMRSGAASPLPIVQQQSLTSIQRPHEKFWSHWT